MKYFALLLTVFLSFSCSHHEVSNANRTPQSVSLPVVQIAADSSNAQVVRAGESIKIKYTLYDSLGTAVAGKIVNFTFSSNTGHFQNNQVTSNYNGVVENVFIAHESEQDSAKRINFEIYIDRPFIGRLTSSQFLTIDADVKQTVLKKFNSLSLVTSSFEWVGEKNLLADVLKDYSLAFVPRDQAGTAIKTDGKFLVNFTVDGVASKATFYTDQTYRLKLKGPDAYGKKTFKVEVKNSYDEATHFIPEFVADFKPVYNFEKVKITKNEANKNTFTASFSILDIYGQLVTQDYLPTVEVVDESGVKMNLERVGETYSFSGEFPYGKGKKIFTLVVANEKLKEPLSFAYNNLELAWDKIELSLDKNYLHPFFVRPAVYDIKQQMESVTFKLKLVDIKGNPLSQLDDVKLSLETKVGKGIFSPLKMIAPGEFQGVFSPENNSQGKIIFAIKNPEMEKELPAILNIGFIPQKNLIELKPEYATSGYADELSLKLFESSGKETRIVGFSFENNGGNGVVPLGSACDSDPQDKLQASRVYSFEFDDQSRQGTRLYVRDDTSSWDSKNRHSSFYFFPRKVIPFFKNNSKSEMELTLPTEEKLLVNRQTGEFISKDILQDGPVDMGTGYPKCPPSKVMAKNYPSLDYKGKGIVLRVNNPTGSAMPEGAGRELAAQVYYFDQVSGKQVACPKLLKTDFFTNGVLKFTSDEAVANFLKLKCGEEFSKRLKALLTP